MFLFYFIYLFFFKQKQFIKLNIGKKTTDIKRL